MKKYTLQQEAELSVLTREYKRLTKAMERNPELREKLLLERNAVVKQKEAIRKSNN